jgi:fatty acyl-CoA reductase
MDIYETFRGKSIFFTGVTGFVGKVFLWKLLKEFPDMESIIVLIRTKKGQKPLDRMQQQVLSSQCFEPLKKQLGEEEWKRRSGKCIAVAGDIMEDKLGMSDADYQMVCDKTNFIVHMAATVNFDERLDVSVQMNVLGSLRVLALAQKAPHLQSYVHMSTCYVNYQRSNRQVVRETIYPLPFDAEDMCKFILAQDPAVMYLVTPRLLAQYNFPNTYTLTKSMGEQILERRKGSLPLTIIRPAIVGCSWKEPMPGWVDALTAAGGIFLTAGLGVLREFHIRGSNITDLVPVDYVVNATLKLIHRTVTFYQTVKTEEQRTITQAPRKSSAVAVPTGKTAESALAIGAAAAPLSSANVATLPRAVSSGSSAGTVDAVAPSLPFVYHASTSSSLNAMRWETAWVAVHSYWNQHPHPKRLHACDMYMTENWLEYQMRIYFLRILPVMAMKAVTMLPMVGSPERKKLVTRLEKAVFRSIDMQRQFAPFVNNEWCFDNTNTTALDEWVRPDQMKNFSCDVYDINWHAYTNIYSYGMMVYIMNSSDGRSPPQRPASGSQLFTKASL